MVTASAGRAGLLAVALIVFQAALVRVIDAGPAVRYQHLLSPAAAARQAPLASLILAAGVVLAAVLLARHRVAATAWLRETTRPGAWLLGLGVLVALAAVPSMEPVKWLTEVASAVLLQLSALVIVGLLAAALPPNRLDRLARWLDQPTDTPGTDRITWLLAGGVVLLSALLALFSYQAHPHVPDEVSYLLQARYFAEGRLALPAPPVARAFDVDLMTLEAGRWYSPFPPGWPLVLAAGVRLGVPWLVNPLLAGVSVLLAARLFGALLPRREARLATLLFALSPWQLFLAMSFMSHTLSLVLSLLAALGLVRMARGAGAWWGWAGGAALGIVSLNRPLEGAALALFLGVVSLRIPGQRFRFTPSVALAGGAFIAGLAGLWYNRAMTGDALTFPVMEYFDRYYGAGVNALGFGANRGVGWAGMDPLPGHGPLDVAINAGVNASAVNVELFGWCVASLLPVVLGVFGRRPDRATWLWLAAILVITGAHAFYWFSGGPDFGARYWFLIIVPAIALAARGLTGLDDAAPRFGPRARAAALALSLAALVVFVPWRATDKYYHYRRMRPDVRRLAAQFGDDGLVLVRGRRHPDYASAAIYNPLDLSARQPIYAWDRDTTARRAVLDAYPDRRVWILEGPTVTGDGFRVVAGPLSDEERRQLRAAP